MDRIVLPLSWLQAQIIIVLLALAGGTSVMYRYSIGWAAAAFIASLIWFKLAEYVILMTSHRSTDLGKAGVVMGMLILWFSVTILFPLQ